jgi:hypothetical protein
MTPDEAVVRESIRQLLAAYHFAGDRGRVDDLAATFAEDGVMEFASGTHCGREAIREALSGVGRREGGGPIGFLHHHLTTSHIDLSGPDSATGSSYFLVMSRVGIDHSGRYADEYVRVEGQWLIARRRVTVAWASTESVVGASASR